MEIFYGHDYVIYVETPKQLTERDNDVICSLFDCACDCLEDSIFADVNAIEVGPIISMETPWGSNAKSILKKCGITVSRIEKTRFYKRPEDVVIDKMVEVIYEKSLTSFKTVNDDKEKLNDTPIYNISEANDKHQLGFDEQDLKFYEDYFKSYNHTPNLIELMDMSQSNSEHSR